MCKKLKKAGKYRQFLLFFIKNKIPAFLKIFIKKAGNF